MMIGGGAAAFLNLKLGEGKKSKARKGIGNALVIATIMSVILLIICLIFLKPILYLFGCTDVIYPYSLGYIMIIVAKISLL